MDRLRGRLPELTGPAGHRPHWRRRMSVKYETSILLCAACFAPTQSAHASRCGPFDMPNGTPGHRRERPPTAKDRPMRSVALSFPKTPASARSRSPSIATATRAWSGRSLSHCQEDVHRRVDHKSVKPIEQRWASCFCRFSLTQFIVITNALRNSIRGRTGLFLRSGIDIRRVPSLAEQLWKSA